ncbi:hypothetical protein K1Y28_09610 [Staphylococcus warneri]|nr:MULTISPECIES: hypothetical protein [Staphylococcus]MBE9429515.1 hypothetical protein [Staphylococcus epidermidis]MBY6180411.1 hypothetical protein [Staphylococcaceae bacterium DP2N0-1]MBO0378319.1 hypothetical protein [Staphylococcus warneri]MCD8804893.1 hypothetical protein [Staphylococcus warneri]MCD8807161.1 hypothetical protein [Staphylococcus warneri]
MMSKIIMIYLALLITLFRFFLPIHPSFETLLFWLFVLYMIPIILCVIGFKGDKLIATMVIIPNLLGIIYRLYVYIMYLIYLK